MNVFPPKSSRWEPMKTPSRDIARTFTVTSFLCGSSHDNVELSALAHWQLSITDGE